MYVILCSALCLNYMNFYEYVHILCGSEAFNLKLNNLLLFYNGTPTLHTTTNEYVQHMIFNNLSLT